MIRYHLNHVTALFAFESFCVALHCIQNVRLESKLHRTMCLHSKLMTAKEVKMQLRQHHFEHLKN